MCACCTIFQLDTYLKTFSIKGEGKERGLQQQGGGESTGFCSLRSGSQGKPRYTAPSEFPMHEASGSPKFLEISYT